MIALLLSYIGPALNIDALALRKRRAMPSRVAAAVVIACLLGAAPTRAQDTMAEAPVGVSITMTDTTVRAGGTILFKTTVKNRHVDASRPLIMAMNIINLNARGEIVDPEDWSPQRTQYIEPITPGQSISLDWRVNAILDGDFMVYMVAIPAPDGPDATSHPVASSGIHVTVTPYTKLNPGGVLPYAIGGPVVLGLIILIAYRHRRAQIDTGGSK